MTWRFAEGDRVVNVTYPMGIGTVTRHGPGPRSIRWTTGGRTAWWVRWDAYGFDPVGLAAGTWMNDEALQPLTGTPNPDRRHAYEALLTAASAERAAAVRRIWAEHEPGRGASYEVAHSKRLSLAMDMYWAACEAAAMYLLAN